MIHTILFLCTGNYYRSRFAEEYFNHLVGANSTHWRADSRGLRLDMALSTNVGPFSAHALSELQRRHIRPLNPKRFPLTVTRTDLENASHIIALNKREHQPMMKALFPSYADSIHYWDVEDLDIWNAERAMNRIEELVTSFFAACIRKNP